jgi:uncharacterized lipoprotein YddW (UPF0748 family)
MLRREFLYTSGMMAASVLISEGSWFSSGQCKAGISAWIWLDGNPDWSNDEIQRRIDLYSFYEIKGILIGCDLPLLERIIPYAKQAGIAVHKWIWTLNRGDTAIMKEHPDWYSVSREGKSCLEKPPYVNYYRWLCPSHPEVLEFLKEEVRRLIQTVGLNGVHLDYIRYCDVILPVALQPTYNLVQNEEFPEYDFCYCEFCRNKFRKESGRDPLLMRNPSADKDWRNFRYHAITNVVNEIALVVHEGNKLLTAAVFPSPELARKMVRQDWDKWNLDAVFPMMYQNFYDENLEWIKTCTQQGVRSIKNMRPIYSGLYVPALDPVQLGEAVKKALAGGAGGVSFFNADSMTSNHWETAKAALHLYQ